MTARQDIPLPSHVQANGKQAGGSRRVRRQQAYSSRTFPTQCSPLRPRAMSVIAE